ncbi:MAG: SDR family oxidoreductase [Vulcanimicrobiota bacterium]
MLEGKKALVTGGSGVLGSVMARGLATAGAEVTVLSRRPVEGQWRSLVGDVTDRDSLVRARDEIAQVDILVNAAGGNQPGATIGPGQDLSDLEPEALDQVIKLNLQGTILSCQVFLEAMSEGCIVNISSMAADRPLSRVVGYSAAKAGVENFTRWLAADLARRGRPIRVNALSPGFFLADQNRALLVQADGSPTARGQSVIEQTPMGRFGQPEELVAPLLFLVSPGASFVTGAILPVDGGFSAFCL